MKTKPNQTNKKLIAENKRTQAKSLDLEKEVPEFFELMHLEEWYIYSGYE
ncbi:MAG: hypothetical protein R3E32_22665 [Chitinophagales bacterium]